MDFLLRRVPLPLAEDRVTGSIYYGLFQVTTAIFGEMRVHASVISAGRSPHPPLGHSEEELLVVLDGDIEFIEQPDSHRRATLKRCLGPGSFVYHPAHSRHTLRGAGRGPSTFLVFKWLGMPKPDGKPVAGSFVFDRAFLHYRQNTGMDLLCDLQTTYLGRLIAHFHTLAPGTCQSRHLHPYDLIMVPLTGTVAAMMKNITAPGVVFVKAGTPHWTTNTGDTQATILTFSLYPH